MRALIPVAVFLSLGCLAPAPAAAQAPRGLEAMVETVYLPVAAASVAAELRRSRLPETRGAVILVSDGWRAGQGSGPAPAVAAELANHGWDVLTVPAPPAVVTDHARGKDTAIPGALARVDAALARVLISEPPAVFLAGHGWGGVVASAALARNQAPPLAGLVLIAAAGPPGAGEEWSTAGLVATIRRPVLDIHGERDYPRVRAGAEARRRAARARGRDAYISVEVPNADHDFTGLEAVLVKRVRGWLAAQPVPPPELPPENGPAQPNRGAAR